jgi:hypothetical protein
MDQSEPARHVPGFVSLQGTDQMPHNRKVWHCFLLLQRFLYPIFSDVAKARRKRRMDCFRSLRLGNRHDAHWVLPAPDRLALGHPSANDSQPGREAWEVHNPLIYRGMLGY